MIYLKEGVNLTAFIKKYKCGIPITIYAVLYMICFAYLEKMNVHGYHLIHTVIDEKIPFCEFFVIPYLLWFPYMIGTVIYFIFWNPDKKECRLLSWNLMMGMTIFLLVSYLYPNGHDLRPVVFERSNVFVDMVKILYQKDTATNILPSIHVFNSLAIHMAIISSKSMKNKKGLCNASLILTILIIMSTMLLKQHSCVDVSLGCTMALAGYLFFYREKESAYEKRYHLLNSHR